MNYIYIFLFIIIGIVIIYSVNTETFKNIISNNKKINNNCQQKNLTYEMVFEQLNMQQIKNYSKTPKLFFYNSEDRALSYNNLLKDSIQKEIISNDPSSILTHKLLDGILLVDNTLQYYLVVSQGLLQIYQIFIENNRVEIIKKVTFNPQGNIPNYHYDDFLHNHTHLIKSYEWRFQNDGILALYDYFGNPFWQSNTYIDKFALTIDKFNLVLTNVNNNDKKIINIDRINNIDIPIADNYNDITESNFIFEYFIKKINKIYHLEDLEIVFVQGPVQNARFKKTEKPPNF